MILCSTQMMTTYNTTLYTILELTTHRIIYIILIRVTFVFFNVPILQN